MFFGNTNAIEPTDAERKRAKEQPPIREATSAEVAGATLRRAREEATPVKAAKASTAPETDPVAERHGLYTSEHMTGRRYYADYQQKSEVMRASAMRISTRLDDKQTVAAMLDLAESRGWQSVKLSGSESFRREAWVQAQMRGVATEGYRPKETDAQELARRQNALERPAAAVRTEAPQAAKAIPVTASKPAPAEAQQPRAQEKPEQVKQAAAPEAAPKARRRESVGEKDAKPAMAAGETPRARAKAKPEAAAEQPIKGAKHEAKQTGQPDKGEDERQYPRVAKEPWMKEVGGLEALKPDQQDSAKRSYERWREGGTEEKPREMGFSEYVSYVQDQEAKARMAAGNADSAVSAPQRDARRQAEAAVWNSVEATGAKAIAAEQTRQAEKPTQAQRAA